MIRLRALLLKEFIQMRRDRLTFGMMIGIPIIQLMLFGFAINTDVKHLPTVVFDQSHSAEGRELIESFSASGYFDMDFIGKSFTEVNTRIDNGDAKVGVILPPDFAENVRTAEQQASSDCGCNRFHGGLFRHQHSPDHRSASFPGHYDPTAGKRRRQAERIAL